MDVEELRARISKPPSAHKSKPLYRYASDDDLEVIRKPRNIKKRIGPAPWDLRKQARIRWQKMDDVDRAKQIEMRQRNVAIEMAKSKPEPKQNIVNGEVICIDCTYPLNDARLAAKPDAARCIECQRDHEQEHRHG